MVIATKSGFSFLVNSQRWSLGKCFVGEGRGIIRAYEWNGVERSQNYCVAFAFGFEFLEHLSWKEKTSTTVNLHNSIPEVSYHVKFVKHVNAVQYIELVLGCMEVRVGNGR